MQHIEVKYRFCILIRCILHDLLGHYKKCELIVFCVFVFYGDCETSELCLCVFPVWASLCFDIPMQIVKHRGGQTQARAPVAAS